MAFSFLLFFFFEAKEGREEVRSRTIQDPFYATVSPCFRTGHEAIPVVFVDPSRSPSFMSLFFSSFSSPSSLPNPPPPPHFLLPSPGCTEKKREKKENGLLVL